MMAAWTVKRINQQEDQRTVYGSNANGETIVAIPPASRTERTNRHLTRLVKKQHPWQTPKQESMTTTPRPAVKITQFTGLQSRHTEVIPQDANHSSAVRTKRPDKNSQRDDGDETQKLWKINLFQKRWRDQSVETEKICSWSKPCKRSQARCHASGFHGCFSNKTDQCLLRRNSNWQELHHVARLAVSITRPQPNWAFHLLKMRLKEGTPKTTERRCSKSLERHHEGRTQQFGDVRRSML